MIFANENGRKSIGVPDKLFGVSQKAKERKADQVACHHLSGTPHGWKSREARRGRQADVLGAPCLLLSTLQTIYRG